jgi:type II secretory pathway pseudopilin PulG
MINQIQFFQSIQLKQKRPKLIVKNGGFTLIELLIGMVMAFLVITPLLGFMINILDTDRKEQAKVSSEQEVQSALDYIAQDLQQAIYIYDAKGIKAIKSQLPQNDATDRVPVLVFWKRQFTKEAFDVKVSGTSKGKNDSFVYSLVIYYLIQDNATNDADKIWSDQFRIARFELKNGIINPDDPTKYLKDPDKGFALFDLIGIRGTLEDKMNAWQKNGNYDLTANQQTPLIDYVDKSKDASLNRVDCTTVFTDRATTGTLTTEQQAKKDALLVPGFAAPNQYSTLTDLNTASFYACVDSDKITAKVFIRGNALARIDNQDNAYTAPKSTYFPTASIQVKGRGLIGGQ